MKHFKILLFTSIFSLLNLSFAEDIYLISNKNYCTLTPKENPTKEYLNSLNQVKEWQVYKDNSVINTNISLNKLAFNTDVCTNTIYLNEKDEGKFNADLLTNKKTSSHPYSITEVKDKASLDSTKKELLSWMYKINQSSVKPIISMKALSGFKHQSQTYDLIEAHSSIDFNNASKKGDFSVVVLYNSLTKEFIPIETWFFKDKQDTLKIINKIEGYLDIDNDGEYEFVIQSSYYEGSLSILYKVINSKAVKKRSCGCGV